METISTGFATCSHQDHISIDIGKGGDSGLHPKGDASLLQELTQSFGDITVHHRQTFLKVFDDRHLTAKTVEHTCELHTDDTSSDDTETLWEGGHLEQFR